MPRSYTITREDWYGPDLMSGIEDDPTYLRPGMRVGAYLIRGFLGDGTGSLVYEVESALGNRYALKLSRYGVGPPGTLGWEMDERFTRSIVSLEQLRDVRWVARIVAHDRYPDPCVGRQYLVQELVPGREKITDWARRTSPSLRALIKVFMQLAEACEDMRLAGIQNRDLKPENILMTPDGEPRLIDFNSAIWHRAAQVTRPSAQAIPSTVAYLPPEVAEARLKELESGREDPFVWTPGGDLYALGVVFYRILTGEHPFNLGVPERELLQEIAFLTPPRPMELQAVPFGLNKVVMRLLERDPEERYQEGDELMGDLEALLRVADDSWDAPYRVPRMDRHDGWGVHTSRTLETHNTSEPVLPPLTPTPPAAIISLSVVPPSSLALLLPTPPRRARGRWWRIGGAVAALLMIGAGLDLGLRTKPAPRSLPATVATIAPPPISQRSSPTPAKKSPSPGWNAAVLTSGTWGRAVRPVEDVPECSADAVETVADLEPGANVICHAGAGCELQAGPIVVKARMGSGDVSGTLIGKAMALSDRVRFRFHELELPDGRKVPICAVGTESVRSSELHPGFLYLASGRIRLRL